MSPSTSSPLTQKRSGQLAAWTVGLVVILMLVGLLVPAVEQVREASQYRKASAVVTQLGTATDSAQAGEAAFDSSADGNSPRSIAQYRGTTAGKPDLPTDATRPETAGSLRKIIYSAEVQLAVEDFAGITERVTALVKQFDGYVAGSNLSGTAGESRTGRWRVRVPVARFDEFVSAAKGLGEVVSAGTTSKDVSEEYYDVDARIRNKTKEEERLLKLLEERPGKLEDVIAIERELSRVREELERMQGRMRVLADLTSLTSVELTVAEIKNYQPAEAAGLSTRIRRSFDGSLSALGAAGANLLVGGAALAAWLPVLALALLVAWGFARRHRRHGSALSHDLP